ncbi:RQC domain-containing protein [Microcoleus sp. F4-D5]|uniref:RQC domain-containing protein n=1 Tax=Microcoleus sp. F4-D5 TaxID=2818760 RepID=UPI004040A585
MALYSNPCRSRKFFTPPQLSPNPRVGIKKFTNDARIAIDVLRGSKNQKFLQDQHHQLSTYGIRQD